MLSKQGASITIQESGTTHQIRRIREAGSIAAQAQRLAEDLLRSDISTSEIETAVEAFLRQHKAVPSIKGYRGFPAAVTICINEEITHGLPSDRRLQDGDLVTIGISVYRLGYHAEMVWTYGVGTITPEADRLLRGGQDALAAGIDAARTGNTVSAISSAIRRQTEASGFRVASGFGGHGIGKRLHEAPFVANEGEPSEGVTLEVGMTLTIEPILCAGNGRSRRLGDGWTVVSEDGSLSAHFGQTIAILDNGAARVLTSLD